MADLNLFFWPVSHFFTKWYNIAQSTFPAFNSNVNETYSTYSTEVYQQHCFSFFCSVAFFPLQSLGGKSFIFHHILSLAETLILSPNMVLKYVFSLDIRRTCAQDYCVQFLSRLLTPNNATVLQFWNVYPPIHELNLVFGIIYSTRLGKQG